MENGNRLIISTACGLVGIAQISSMLWIFWLKRKAKDKYSDSSFKGSLMRISYEMLHKATDDFSSGNIIGTGGSRTVYRGNLEDQDGMIIAIKVFNIQNCRSTKSFKAECEALRNIRHRNVVRILTSCSSIDLQGNDFKALVYEYMPNGNLETWLHPFVDEQQEEDRSRYLNLSQRLNIAIDIASALNYLHHHCQTRIIHRDLKRSNALLDHDMIAHLGDFGIARILSESSPEMEHSSIRIKGTVGYARPEYGMGSQASTYGDVYSYGILLLEMFTGKSHIDDKFKDGLDLHNFVRMSLHEPIRELADDAFSEDEKNQATNTLASIFRIGIACSVDTSRDRMDIADVLAELISIRSTMNRSCELEVLSFGLIFSNFTVNFSYGNVICEFDP